VSDLEPTRKDTRRLTRTAVPGVYRRGKTYVIRFRGPDGRQQKRHAHSFEEARDLKASLTADIKRGEFHERGKVSFEDYAREWIGAYQGRTSRGFRESTRVGYRRTIEAKAIPYFGKRTATLSELEPRDVRAFIAWLFDERAQGRTLSASTVRSHLAAVKVLLATAVEDGLLRSNPARGVRVARPGAPAIEPDPAEVRRALDSDELARFLQACSPEWRPFFRLLAMTGLRISEAVELRWQDVDFAARRLRVRRQFYEGTVAPPKSRHGTRDIPLSTAMTRLLWPRQGRPDELLFSGARGQRVGRRWLGRTELEPARRAAGLPWMGFHTLRHTCASMLFAEGRNAKQVSMWLGHSDAAFTLRCYVHLLDDGLGDADFFDGAGWATEGPHEPRQTRQTGAPAQTAEAAR
jgi:integrase